MIKTKIKRIEELDDKYLILNEKEMGFLRKCLQSRKQDVRWTAVKILVGWYSIENESLLYHMIRLNWYVFMQLIPSVLEELGEV